MENWKRNYNLILKEICIEENILMKAFSYNWIFQLKKDNKTKYICGYAFDLNEMAVAQICHDKCALSDVLIDANIPCVPHHFFMDQENIKFIGINDSKEPIYKLFQEYQKVVCKPNEGTSGINVILVETKEELSIAIDTIFSKSRAMAISPYMEIKHEYRVVYLDGQIKLIYDKIRGDNWKHNLSEGTKPKIVLDQKIIEKLTKLTNDVAQIIPFRFASVDIVEVENELMVLEVNSGVCMERFSQENKEYYQIAKDIYKEAIQKMFN